MDFKTQPNEGVYDFLAVQRDPVSGCIPAGYETLLRQRGCKDIDFEYFQDEFNLDKHLKSKGKAENSFQSIAKLIMKKYPVTIIVERFEKGEDKVASLENLYKNEIMALVSLPMKALRKFSSGWHIMPVVKMDADCVTLAHHKKKNGEVTLIEYTKDELIQIHNTIRGGKDIAYIAD